MKDIKVQDAIDNSWVDNYAPLWTRPYLRLSRMDRPVGTWLLFLPCVFGATLGEIVSSAGIGVMLHVLLVCAVGSLLMRGAGCVWNDIVDRDIDAQVERTRSRPLPSGQITVKAALAWMAAQMLVSFLLLLTFKTWVVWFAISSIAIVTVYPFAKRVTNWPQVVLALCFNWGALVAWVQIDGFHWGMLPLFGGMIAWTLFYDTIYAYQDIEDDALIGVGSSARALGDQPRPALTWMITATAFLLFVSVMSAGEISPWSKGFFLFGIALFTTRSLIGMWRVDFKDPPSCLRIFRAAVVNGQLLAMCWLIAYLIGG